MAVFGQMSAQGYSIRMLARYFLHSSTEAARGGETSDSESWSIMSIGCSRPDQVNCLGKQRKKSATLENIHKLNLHHGQCGIDKWVTTDQVNEILS
jgi:hypothetical protein